MAQKVQFELVSPERLLVAQAVDMVVVPGTEGNFGVLAGHAPLISTVRPGVIDMHEAGTVSNRIFVAGGFAEVTPERCTVLAEEAVPLKDLDRAELDAELRRLNEELGLAREESERTAIGGQIAILTAKIAAIS